MVLKTTAILGVVVLLLGVAGTGRGGAVVVLLDIVGVGVAVASWISVEVLVDASPIFFL